MGHRRHSDYQYQIDGHTLRVERYGDGWRWIVFWGWDGEQPEYGTDEWSRWHHEVGRKIRVTTQTDDGEYCRLKRDAKVQGMERIAVGETHGKGRPLSAVLCDDGHEWGAL